MLALYSSPVNRQRGDKREVGENGTYRYNVEWMKPDTHKKYMWYDSIMQSMKIDMKEMKLLEFRLTVYSLWGVMTGREENGLYEYRWWVLYINHGASYEDQCSWKKFINLHSCDMWAFIWLVWLFHCSTPHLCCHLQDLYCSMWALSCNLRAHVGSSSLTRKSNLCPLHWEHRLLTTGPPGKSQLVNKYFLIH